MTKSTALKPKPSVAIIGPGRLGQALGLALDRVGYQVVALVARESKHAKRALANLNKAGMKTAKTAAALGIAEVSQLPKFGLVLISTPDDAITETALRLADLGKARNATALHTSGALPSDVLAPLAAAGYHTGSMHPLVSVSEPKTGAEAFRGAYFCVEGDPAATKLANKIVKDLKGTAFSIKPENKALYHAAAVMASPHLVALFDLAVEMLAACGLSQQTAINVLLPLTESTANNLRAGPGKALTGTFARGDVATVEKHLAALSKKQMADALAVYKLLGMRSLTLAEKNKLDPHLVKQIKLLLK